jgi:hypothetical protein
VPEPERALPEPVAALREGRVAPSREGVQREQARLEQVILHGSAGDWLRQLSSYVALVRRPVEADLRPAALTVAEVVRDHHRLLQGLSPWLSARTRRERLELEDLVRRLRSESGRAA